MRDEYYIIDCDRHVMEPADIWEKYLEPGFESFGVRSTGPFTLTTIVNGRRWGGGAPVLPGVDRETGGAGGFGRNPQWRAKFKRAMYRNFDNVAYLDDMDREGVDQAVLFSSIGLYFCWVDDMDQALSAAMCRAYNNWLHDYCSIDSDRLKGVCLLPLQNPDLAEKELNRAINDLGMVGVFWRPNPLNEREVTNADYDGIYAQCAESGLAICFHEGQSTTLRQFAKGRVDTRFGRHSCSHPMEQMGAVVRTISEGVFDRYAGLNIAFMESGAGWLPACLERLDHLWDVPQYREQFLCAERPSTYFKRGSASISCEAGEPTTSMVGAVAGEDCLMWASDYPHPDCLEYFPDTFGGILANDSLSDEFKRKILADNPARVFNLERKATAVSQPWRRETLDLATSSS